MRSSPIAGFQGLPIEIIEDIFLHVKAVANTAALARCVLCCKAWRDIVQPIIYSHVVITNSNIKAFVKSLNTVLALLIDSLTINITLVFLESPGMSSKAEYRTLLCQIGDRLTNMLNLRTFSFMMTPIACDRISIPSSTVALIVESLPETCVNLELDIQGLNYTPCGTTTPHICESIRNMVPRLRHLRLRLRDLCPAFLGTGFDLTSSENYFSNFVPVLASNLETLVINCMLCETIHCQAHMYSQSELQHSRSTYHRRNARQTFIAALQDSKQASSFPAARSIIVLDYTPSIGNHDLSLCQAIIPCDVLANLSTLLPVGGLRGDTTQSWIRMVDGQDLICTACADEPFAEGDLWYEDQDGVRYPRSVRSRRASIVPRKKLRIVTREQWTNAEENSGLTCDLWRKEAEMGVQLLYAEARDGLSDTSPLRKRIPS